MVSVDDVMSEMSAKHNLEKSELEQIRRLVEVISSKIKSRYQLESFLGIGGSGVVLKVRDKNLDIPMALKFPRPAIGKEKVLAEVLGDEIEKLLALSHSNVIRICYYDSIDYSGGKRQFYVMDFIDGGRDCLKYMEVNRAHLDQETIVGMVLQIAIGMDYLHSSGMIHGDMKLENALMTPDKRVILSDMGSARLLKSSSETTTISCTEDYAHPKLRELMRLAASVSDANRAHARIKRSELTEAMDFYAFGKNLFRLLDLIDKSERDVLSAYALNYLQLMAARCLDGYNDLPSEMPLGLTKTSLNAIKYHNAKEIVDDLMKLAGQFDIVHQVPELDQYSASTIQASSFGACALTPRLAALVNSPLIKRLGTISQLGLIAHIFPTATHSRLEHVLGTYSVAVRYCLSLWNDPVNPIFKQVVTPHDIRCLLCAAILHDVGHFGLAHDFEEASRKFNHSDFTKEIISGNAEQKYPGSQELIRVLKTQWAVDENEVLSILDPGFNETDAPVCVLLHSIIDGPIDADKIDYLVRDSKRLGLPYGDGVDLPRLLRCLTVIVSNNITGQLSIGVYEKAKITAEAIVFLRYCMFGCVYWHHTSRSAKAMLHRAIWEYQISQKHIEIPSSFSEVIFRGKDTPGQLELSVDESKAPLVWPPLSDGDIRVLSWLDSVTSQFGKELIGLIKARSLFKRLCVVSNFRKGNHKFWQNIQTFRPSATPEKIVQFQNSFEKELMKHVASQIESHTRSPDCETGSRYDLKAKYHEAEERLKSSQHLVLVDIPPPRHAARSELQMLSEERINGTRRMGAPAPAIEESLIWRDIGNNFLESVGKVRVFVHPDFVWLFECGTDKAAVETILSKCLDKTM